MGEIIVDGTGKAYAMRVDAKGNAHVDAITTDREAYSVFLGNSYSLNTGLITLTNANTKNAVMYVKNNEDYPLIFQTFFYMTGASTGGSGDIYVDLIRNPTTGTIISGASPVEMNVNRNYGSSRTLNIVAYKGATGTTFTNGIKNIESILATTTQRVMVSVGSITLPKGASIGINITTPTGNTSMVVEFAAACYLDVEVE